MKETSASPVSPVNVDEIVLQAIEHLHHAQPRLISAVARNIAEFRQTQEAQAPAGIGSPS